MKDGHAESAFLHPECPKSQENAMIPEVTNPNDLRKSCPINLCNILYKIGSKVLANLLKLILPSNISKQQRDFVTERLIIVNVLVDYECLHTIRKKRSKKSYFALKIDTVEDYDMVEWPYLHGCLLKLGFD